MRRAIVDRRHFLAKMVAATGALLAWPRDSSADTPSLLPPGSPAGPEDESYWSRVRAEFAFEPNLIYFNNASLGVPPRSVTNAVAEGYQRLAANPAGKTGNDGLCGRHFSTGCGAAAGGRC